MTVTIIAAVTRNGAIGIDGHLACSNKEDMRHFRAVTEGKVVIMGRKTWESLPSKPLPGRLNIVISNNPVYVALGATLVYSLDDAIATAQAITSEEVFIIGGGQVYAETLCRDLANRMVLTEFDIDTIGDVFFPRFTSKDWKVIATKRMCGFQFTTYEKTEPIPPWEL